MSPGDLRGIQASLEQLKQSLSSMQLLKEQMDRETESRIQQLNVAVEQITTNFRRSSLGKYLDSFDSPIKSCDTPIKSCDRNNNRPVNDDDAAQKPGASTVQRSPWKTSSAPLLEQETTTANLFTSWLFKPKKSKAKKGSATKHEYVLVPLPTGLFGDVLQKKPNGKPKYTDVMTVIRHGTANHKVKSLTQTFANKINYKYK